MLGIGLVGVGDAAMVWGARCRAGRGHAAGGGAALLAPAAGRAALPARARRGAPRPQAREHPAGPPRQRQDLRLRDGYAVQARLARAAAGARVRHAALRRARGAGGGRAPLPRRARRPVGRRARAARHARRRSVPSSPRPSRAAPADLWAAALVLLAMLVGGQYPPPRAPPAPRPPTCGPPRWCCSPCSSASCRGSARRRRTRAGRRGRRGRRRARARRRCRSRGCRRTRWRCCGARCSRRPRRARRWSGCCACAGSSKKRRRCAPGARSPAPPTPTRPTPTCRPPTWTRCSATRSPRSPTTCCWPRSTTRPARRYRPPRAPPSAHAVDGTFNADDVFLPQNELIMQRLVRRMTRVRLRCDEATALRALCEAARALGYTTRRLDHSRVAIECDAEVRMRAWAARAAGGALLELRRSRGCGLQFKRRYLRLRDALRPLAEPDD
ncbi:translation initiation factor IF-2 isoform X4 [Ostrinia furnacalis]|nr:translation initiation factor IF-2 isoform X4 [Ostrinia furnacalis]